MLNFTCFWVLVNIWTPTKSWICPCKHKYLKKKKIKNNHGILLSYLHYFLYLPFKQSC